MKIGVVGTGYVGLVQGVIMAEFGLNVICMDVSEEKIESLRNGIVPIYEPGLKELLEKNMKAGRIEFTTDMKYSTENSEVISSRNTTSIRWFSRLTLCVRGSKEYRTIYEWI